MKTDKPKIAVLGSGSWGTALAIVLAKNGYQVNLWGFFADEVSDIKKNGINTKYLPGIKLPANIAVYSDVSEALASTRDVLLVVPSSVFGSTLNLIKPHLSLEARIFFATKGLAPDGKLLHEEIKSIIGDIPSAVVSGPTFAREVAEGLPTAVTIAFSDISLKADLLHYFHGGTFRVYTSSDIVGVEIGGTVKNILAIAVGISDGMGFGSNARAALITRGLAELTRLGIALGGKMETFMGLAGLGDLVLTCTDNQSRNRRFGINLGKGLSFVESEKIIQQTIEGISNTKLVFSLAQKLKIDMPITEQVYRILYENLSPEKAVKALLSRESKSE